VNTAGGSISALLKGFPGLYIEEFDGTDVIESYQAAGRAVRWARERKGPALLHAHVVRPYSHSLSDDERMYRPEAERSADAARDPIRRLGTLLVQQKIATEAELKALEDDVVASVTDASERALQQPQPVTGIELAFGVVREPGEDLNIMAPVAKRLGEREPLEHRFRVEPLGKEEDLHPPARSRELRAKRFPPGQGFYTRERFDRQLKQHSQRDTRWAEPTSIDPA